MKNFALRILLPAAICLLFAKTYAYDLDGELTNKTDFNGYSTAYQYDLMGRLLAKVPDARRNEPAITFGYNLLGLRTNMTDASGVTAYQYDVRNRLVQKATPQGALAYGYDANGNLTNILSSNTNGANVSYAYDALNRLDAVNDAATGVTVYNYDAAGNLQSFICPNLVSSVYQYDALNRLTNLASGNSLNAIAQYAYTVGPAGNRLTASETVIPDPLNPVPRTINRVYTYDNVYQLTGESISGAPGNAALNYLYDPVGNRLTRSVLNLPLVPQNFGFDANDRLASDTYDANGNTTLGHLLPGSPAVSDSYDFENRLTARTNPDGSTITIVYDGDGNRVAKTVTTATNSLTTRYLVDDLNPSGYAQVLEEQVSVNNQPATLACVYTYGHMLISQDRFTGSQWAPSFYGYDGHNNVRYLTDLNGQVTDTYDYDAFGTLIARTGNTPNNYLFTGEQYDPDLGLYYLRARYHNTDSGRFWNMDSYEGNGSDPGSLHKYTYCKNNPVNASDPSGQITLAEIQESTLISSTLSFSLFGAMYGAGQALLTGGDPIQGAENGAFFGAIGGATFGMMGGPAAMASLPANYWTTRSGMTLLALMTAIGSYSVTDALNHGQYGLAAWNFAWTAAPIYGAGRSSSAIELETSIENSYAQTRRATLFPVTGTPEPINPPKITQPYEVVVKKLSGVYNFVTMPGGKLRLGRINIPGFPNKHMDLSGGGPVMAAGEVTFDQGRVVMITDDSGHYNQMLTPIQRAIEEQQAIDSFNENGLPSDGKYQRIH